MGRLWAVILGGEGDSIGYSRRRNRKITKGRKNKRIKWKRKIREVIRVTAVTGDGGRAKNRNFN